MIIVVALIGVVACAVIVGLVVYVYDEWMDDEEMNDL